MKILSDNNTPSNVIAHSKKVCEFAEKLADGLIDKGIKVNKNLVIAGALLHDVKRVKKNHALEGAKLLESLGYSDVASSIRKHCLYQIELKENQPISIEEKIVFYADKRVTEDKIVSLEYRFKALSNKYKKDFLKELEFAKKIEKELLYYGD